MKENSNNKSKLAIIVVVYLAGIFMGAIDTGIVTPARTIIQNSLSVDDKTGIWMITIYTLAYAASIPVMGKLADRMGRKTIYMISISLFGLGSLFCGLSHYASSFPLLIAARALQAVGGGGIMPIATAEFSTSFPREKRGMALGLLGGVYGIANIFGSLAGSAILDIFGTENWQYIFFVNIPISIFIIAMGLIYLPNNKEKSVKKIDGLGILLIVAMVLCLLYGLKQIDFFNFASTITDIGTYPFLIAFVILVPIFILVEKKADDPIMNLSYFTNTRILTTLAVSFTSGFVLMGIVFIPQFAENSLIISSGSGGYFTVILGLLSGVSAMLSGRLIDKYGAKLVLLLGFLISIVGSLFLVFVASPYPSMFSVILSLMLLGFGMGFTIGAPINYMMLENTKESESGSALSAVSLIRSIGTSIAPALMVGFIAHAGMSMQSELMNVLPTEITMPPLPYVQEINDKVNEIKQDPNMSDKLGDFEIPDLASMETVKIDFSGNGDMEMPDDAFDEIKSADVTNITDKTKIFASQIFDLMSPDIIQTIQSGIQSGIGGIGTGKEELNGSIADMQEAITGIGEGIAGMQDAVAQQEEGLKQLNALLGMALSGAIQLDGSTSVADLLPPIVKDKIPESVLQKMAEIKTTEDIRTNISELEDTISTLKAKIDENTSSQSGMKIAIEKMKIALTDMDTLRFQMSQLSDAIPNAFDTAKVDYLTEIEKRSEQLTNVYQDTLNKGFSSIYVTVLVSSALAILILILYRKKTK